MPEAPLVTDPPPPALQAELDALSMALDEQIPSKQLDRNLLIGTWNLREFGPLTKKWQSEEGDSPKRDLFSVRIIAAVLSRSTSWRSRRSRVASKRSARCCACWDPTGG